MLDLSIGKCEYSTDTRTIEYHGTQGTTDMYLLADSNIYGMCLCVKICTMNLCPSKKCAFFWFLIIPQIFNK
jgi:hypothetical protein